MKHYLQLVRSQHQMQAFPLFCIFSRYNPQYRDKNTQSEKQEAMMQMEKGHRRPGIEQRNSRANWIS